MADTASVTLRDLRRKIRATEDSIRTKLDAIIKNSTTNKFLQDAVVSIRNGRYVVPVRAEYRGEVGGVIHDVSSTGSTVFVEPPLWWKPRPHYAAARPRAGGNHPAF